MAICQLKINLKSDLKKVPNNLRNRMIAFIFATVCLHVEDRITFFNRWHTRENGIICPGNQRCIDNEAIVGPVERY